MLPGANLLQANLSGREVILLQLALGQWGVALGDGSCARGERVVLPYMLPGANLLQANLSGREVILLQLAVGQWGVALGDGS